MAAKKTQAATKEATVAETKTQNMFNGKLFEDALGRMDAMVEEFKSYETKGADQMRTAVDEFAKLQKAQMDYALQLTAEWRKLAMESTRRAADLMGASA